MNGSEITAETGLGPVRGARVDSVLQFRGVPFARPPVGDLRLAPPQPVTPWQDPFDATQPAAVAPQRKSRLADIMGDFDRPQAEDCLTLTITTPGIDDRRRPVIVWLHGGGFSSGSGALDWYDGQRLATDGGVVVVGVNYRLGALGYLCAEGVSAGNLGVLDQALALSFVRAHVSAFGGDPDNVTLMGQSAGGSSIVALFAGGHVPEGVRRAIILSGAIGMAPQDLATARRIGRDFVQRLGVDPDSADVRQQIAILPTAALLEAQAATVQAEAQTLKGLPAFHLVANGDSLPLERPFEGALRGGMNGIELIIGTTRDEMAAFFHDDTTMQAFSAEALATHAAAVYGSSASARLQRLRVLSADASPGDQFAALAAEDEFLFPALRLAETISDAGGHAYVYAFDWRSPMPNLKSCHCLELPFVFGTGGAWRDAPMLKGSDPNKVERLSTAMRAYLQSFACNGIPHAPAMPEWRPYDCERRATMRFDDNIQLVDDPAGFAPCAEDPAFAP